MCLVEERDSFAIEMIVTCELTFELSRMKIWEFLQFYFNFKYAIIELSSAIFPIFNKQRLQLNATNRNYRRLFIGEMPEKSTVKTTPCLTSFMCSPIVGTNEMENLRQRTCTSIILITDAATTTTITCTLHNCSLFCLWISSVDESSATVSQ